MHRALRPRYKGPDAKTIGPTFAAVIDALARALVDAAQTLFRLRAAPRTLPVPEVGGTRWIRS
ncbi:hypothetical protein GTY68_27460 [Streptomyces sp. SID4926]|nr:hypothetical protein [Streptomyces sp. SID4926]